MLHDSPILVTRRRGVILLVVVSMLTLFAIVGLSFVMYAESEAQGSKLSREAQFRPEVQPDLLVAFALGQLIYDVDNNETGIYSAMRGHSLARSMYGWNDTLGVVATNTPGGVNIVPFNGVGRLKYAHPFPSNPPNTPFTGQRDETFLNFQHFRDVQLPAGFVNAIRDPERLGVRPTLTAPLGPYTGGINVPYTYPDVNNPFLAAVRAADGTLLMQSFYRPWLFPNSSSPNSPLAEDNPNWWATNYGKHLILRPRPVDQITLSDWTQGGLPPALYMDLERLTPAQHVTLRRLILDLQARGRLFPYPEDDRGDVKNLVGVPGGNDSFWMDLNFPVMKTPEGVRYKPMFAFHIQDLDNRVNLNVHSNVRGRSATGQAEHRSNQGFGPWEVNVGKVLTGSNPATRGEWANLFRGDTVRQWSGRYGLDPTAEPSASDLAASGRTPHFYSQVDFDSSRQNDTASGRFSIPGSVGYNGGLSPFPVYAAGTGWDNGITGERQNHPLLYDVLMPRLAGNRNEDDRRFALSNMEALLRYSDTGSPAMTSELFQLCPENFRLDARTRGLVTVRSFDLDRPGVAPWLWYVGVNENPTYPDDEFKTTNPGTTRTPHSQAPLNDFPLLTYRTTPVANLVLQEFAPNDWRWRPVVDSALSRVDLNRKLAPYPVPENPIQPTYSFRFDDPQRTLPGDPVEVWKRFLKAQEDRQRFANDIYERLLAAVGVPRFVVIANPLDDYFHIRRWLAQLAVNIVDYIDDDDISTPFHFYKRADAVQGGHGGEYDPGRLEEEDNFETLVYWVVGTELPRVVLNEVLVETERKVYDDPSPTDQEVRVFAEILNPLSPPQNGSTQYTQPQDGQSVRLRMIDTLTSSVSQPPRPSKEGPYNVFKVEVTKGLVGKVRTTEPDFEKNVLGRGVPVPNRLNDQGGETDDRDFVPASPDSVVTMVNGAVVSPGRVALSPGEFMLLGPKGDPPGGAAGDGQDGRGTIRAPAIVPPMTLWMKSERMKFTVMNFGDPVEDGRADGLTVALRRLANPHLPYEPNASINFEPNPWYNPYVTIDHIDHNPIRHYNPDQNPGTYTSRGKQQPFAAFMQRAPQANPLTIADPLLNSTVRDTNTTGAGAADTIHTFGKVNHDRPMPLMEPHPLTPLRGHYNWLAHMDRQLASPLELLHVSGFAPHELTQRFVTTYELPGTTILSSGSTWRVNIGGQTFGDTSLTSPSSGGPYRLQNGDWVVITNTTDYSTPTQPLQVSDVTNNGFTVTANPGSRSSGFRVLGQHPYNHRVRWFDEHLAANVSSRLYRFFELANCGSRAAGVAPGGRVPGKININTIWDPETLRALVDLVDDTPANQLFASFLMRDTSGLPPTNPARRSVRTQGPVAGTSPATISANDRPFWGFGFGQYPPTDQQFGQGSGIYDAFLRSRESQMTGHPYEMFELPSKVLNNLTTRSNVFAVWVTVGFFEVTDDTTRPVKLGAEIGRTENRHVRPRFFSIVDRTNLSIANVTYAQRPTAPGQNVPMEVQSVGSVFNGRPWSIQPGDTVVVDAGERQEAVIVRGVGPGSRITANFTQPHEAGAPISLPNLPGEPPIFLKAADIEIIRVPAGQPPQYWITVPVLAATNASLDGEYDGLSWRIQRDRPTVSVPLTLNRLIVGNGAYQRGVNVLEVQPAPSGRYQTPHGRFRVQLTPPYPPTDPRFSEWLPPEPLTISNTILGNPGPQPQFNPRHAPFSAIVRYLNVIQ